MTAETVTRYVVQVLLVSGKWNDATTLLSDLSEARKTVRDSRMTPANIRIVERRTTVVDEVLP